MAGFASDIELTRGYVLIEAKPELQRGLRKANMQLQQFAGNLRSMAFAAGAMATGVTLAAVPMIRTFVEFDDQMRMLQGVLGATGQQFEALRNTVRQLGRDTSYTAAQVAEAATNLARAGLDESEVEAALEPMLNLARATGTALPDAARIAANALRTFQIHASEAERVVDVLVNTTNSSNQILTELAEAVAYAGVEANAAGASIEETSAIIGVLADRGIVASRAGTSLRRVYKNLANELKRAKIEELGIPVMDEAGDFRNVVDILDDVGRAMNEMGGVERASLVEQVFGARGADAARIIADSAGSIRELADANQRAAGTAADLAYFIDAGLGGAFRRLWSQFGEFSIIIGEAIAEPLTAFAAGLKTIIYWFGYFAKTFPILIRALVLLTATVVAAAAAIVGLSLVMLWGAKMSAILTGEFAKTTAAAFGMSAGFTTATASLVRFLMVAGMALAIAAPLLAAMGIIGVMALGAPAVSRNRNQRAPGETGPGPVRISDLLMAPFRHDAMARIADVILPDLNALREQGIEGLDLGEDAMATEQAGVIPGGFTTGGVGSFAANAIQLQPANVSGDSDTELLQEIRDNTETTARNTGVTTEDGNTYYVA